jgi:hypothetical protein
MELEARSPTEVSVDDDLHRWGPIVRYHGS